MKKLLSALLIVMCLLMVAMPHMLLAEDEETEDVEIYQPQVNTLSEWENHIYIGNTPINMSNMSGDNWFFVNFGGTYLLTLEDGFSLNTSKNLDDSDDKAFIQVSVVDNLTIYLEGSATIGTDGLQNSSSNTYGIYAPKTNLSIQSSNGDLKIYSGSNAIWCSTLTVNSTNLTCKSFKTAIRALNKDELIYKRSVARNDINITGGSTVVATTTDGRGIYPTVFYPDSSYGNFYGDDGGAAILADGRIFIEDSIVEVENNCKRRPAETGDYLRETCSPYFVSKTFCSSIFSTAGIYVSGSDAKLTARIANNNNAGFNDSSVEGFFTVNAITSSALAVADNATIEGYTTTKLYSEYSSGINGFSYYEKSMDVYEFGRVVKPKILLTGQGTIINGISSYYNDPGTVDVDYAGDSAFYPIEDKTPTGGYPGYRKITIMPASDIYLRSTESGQEFSFQSDFKVTTALESMTIDLGDIENSIFVEKGYDLEKGLPSLHFVSGDWTVLPNAKSTDYYVESGTLSINPSGKLSYEGGNAYLAEGAKINIEGDGIGRIWHFYPLNENDTAGGEVHFINGSIYKADASLVNDVYIHGGNIGFEPQDGQIVRDPSGKQLFKHKYVAYIDSTNTVLESIATPGGTIVCADEYFYVIDQFFSLWNISDTTLYYGNCIKNGTEEFHIVITSSYNSNYHSLTVSTPFHKLDVNPNYRFYRAYDESITLNAGTIKTYENWMDINDPHCIGESSTLPSNMRAVWFYVDGNGELVYITNGSLSLTIDDLSGIDNYRTYVCKVTGPLGEDLGTYSANVHVMRWKDAPVIQGYPGEKVSLAIEPVDAISWDENLLSTEKWQVDKGSGWENIPDSARDVLEVDLTAENINYQYRKVVSANIIGNFDKHENSIYIVFESPALKVTATPVIKKQPTSIKIHEKDTSNHELSLEAQYASSYQWEKLIDGNYVAIEGANANKLKVSNADFGSYRCVVGNEYGEVISSVANVSKKDSPQAYGVDDVTIKLNESGSFKAYVNGDDDGSVGGMWQYSKDNGQTWTDVKVYNATDNIVMYFSSVSIGDNTPFFIDSTLTIRNATKDMDGWIFRCVVWDEYDKYYSNTAKLTIELPKYTITFNNNGLGTATEPIADIVYGSKAPEPAKPKENGYRFEGWYLDEECSQPYDFDSEVYSDLTLFAKWSEKSNYVIVVNSHNGTLPKIISGISWNEDVFSHLSEPVRDGYSFDKWTCGDTVVVNDLTYGYLCNGQDLNSITIDANWLDVKAPVIKGAVDGETYCKSVTITVFDNEKVSKVFVNNEDVALDKNGKITLTNVSEPLSIVAIDESGNSSAPITITISPNHLGPTVIKGIIAASCDHEGYSGDRYCRHCGKIIESGYVIEKIAHVDNNSDHSCENCQKLLSNHQGGEANCINKAICTYCGKAYGDLDENNHDLFYKENDNCYQCRNCGKIFKDDNANEEISPSTDNKPELSIIDDSIAKGSDEKLEVDLGGQDSSITEVYLDGRKLEAEEYELGEKLVINPQVLSKLEAGEHQITIKMADDEINISFTINEATSPSVGNSSGMTLVLSLGAVVAATLVGIIIIINRRKKDE